MVNILSLKIFIFNLEKNEKYFMFIIMNQLIIQELTKLSYKYNEDPSLKFKKKAIDNALMTLKEYKNEIKSGDDAKNNIKGIGKGIADRIDEIIKNGKLKENDIETKECELKKIHGLGDKRIEDLKKQGIDTIEKFKKLVDTGDYKLTHAINLGLKYYQDFEQRIPRKEIEDIEKIIQQNIKKKEYIFNICGSYRRGKETCGDIDVLITSTNNENYLKILIKDLKKNGLIIDDLTEKGEKKYMGVCKISNIARRIDVRYIDYQSYYPALIYFTGSKEFNILIRNEAIRQGYSLSEYGLKKELDESIIFMKNEKEIFDLLGMKYFQPNER